MFWSIDDIIGLPIEIERKREIIDVKYEDLSPKVESVEVIEDWTLGRPTMTREGWAEKFKKYSEDEPPYLDSEALDEKP